MICLLIFSYASVDVSKCPPLAEISIWWACPTSQSDGCIHVGYPGGDFTTCGAARSTSASRDCLGPKIHVFFPQAQLHSNSQLNSGQQIPLWIPWPSRTRQSIVQNGRTSKNLYRIMVMATFFLSIKSRAMVQHKPNPHYRTASFLTFIPEHHGACYLKKAATIQPGKGKATKINKTSRQTSRHQARKR